MQKYINKFTKCLSKDNNMFKVAACAVIGWMVFFSCFKSSDGNVRDVKST